MHLFNKKLTVEYTNDEGKNSIYTFFAPSITRVERFKAEHKHMITILQASEHKSERLLTALAKDLRLHDAFDKIFRLFDKNLDYRIFSEPTLFKLIFPHQEAETYNTLGSLVKFVVGEISPGDTTYTQPEADAYVKLLSDCMRIFEDFDQATKMLESLTYEDLAKLFARYVEAQMTDEQKAKAKTKEDLKAAQSKTNVQTNLDIQEMSEEDVKNILGIN